MAYTFFAFLSRMKYINRWALMRNTFEENLSTHSFEVACISHMLAVIGNRRFGKNYNVDRAAVSGLYHDMPEILTGDMPTPVKYYNPEIKKAYDSVESAACGKLLSSLPEEFREDFSPFLSSQSGEEHRLVKAADKLSAYIKCVEERKAGNAEFSKAEETVRRAIEELDCPEADVFLREFMPAYELTLDQISDI